jgi:ribonucrease Y
MSTSIIAYLLAGLVGGLLGIGIFELIRRSSSVTKKAQEEEQSRQAIQNAQREAENIVKEAKLEAKDLLLQSKMELEKEQKAKMAEFAVTEKRAIQRDEALEHRISTIDKRDSEAQKRDLELSKREEKLLAKEAACARVEKEHREALERIAGITAEEAKKQLIQEMESQARLEAVGHAKRTLEEARENAEREAREIITNSIQRVVRDYVSESTISVVPIPNDAMKGRIIGREGRNIRAIEAATGIDLIIDETPEAVIVSGFDPLRREIAKVSLERLMLMGASILHGSKKSLRKSKLISISSCMTRPRKSSLSWGSRIFTRS